jgi:hypothetical protein
MVQHNIGLCSDVPGKYFTKGPLGPALSGMAAVLIIAVSPLQQRPGTCAVYDRRDPHDMQATPDEDDAIGNEKYLMVRPRGIAARALKA